MAKTDSVVDAGPLIHLDELESLDLLGDVSSLITVDTVWEEARKHRPALSDLVPQSLRLVPLATGPSKELSVLVETLNLDAGEKDALILAEQEGSGLFLTDDSAARFAGESMGLRVHGTIGILLRSIRRGLRTQSEVEEILATIRTRSTLYLSERLLDEVMNMLKGE